jgi:hypothetical protein
MGNLRLILCKARWPRCVEDRRDQCANAFHQTGGRNKVERTQRVVHLHSALESDERRSVRGILETGM